MKRFFLLILDLWRQRAKLYISAAVIGVLAGVFVLYPINDFVYFHEHGVAEPNAGKYVLSQLKESLKGNTPDKTRFYAWVGIVLSVLLVWIYGFLHRKFQRIELLTDELERDLRATIRLGEGPLMEFKSSFRWDVEKSCINRSLEKVVLKTLAGYMNGHSGGTLLIGVGDNGKILGLENDYHSLKKQNQDGFEQAIMTAISTQLGGDLCQNVKVLFHVVDHKDVCRLIVLPAPRPVFLKQGSDPRFYLRTGGGTRDLNIQEATEFIAHRWPK